MSFRRLVVRVLILMMLGGAVLPAQVRAAGNTDRDRDGLDDGLERALLLQFAPTFMVGRRDCAGVPAEFRVEQVRPEVEAENGTIYGQVFPSGEVFPSGHVLPAKGTGGGGPMAEIHFYHLWSRDCGAHGHVLDTEHVSVLVRASGANLATATWKAVYWYAAAHENTVCDVSQIARASTLGAEDRGAKVWISPGKHASYLNETLCRRGCGADRCEEMTALKTKGIVNLGEPSRPMNGAAFTASTVWPLEAKMKATNFPAEPVARLERLPETDIAWFSAGRHPAQQIISISASTEGAIAGSGQDTTAAISVAEESTGNALGRSYRNTKHALGISVRHVGEALHVTP